MSTKFQLGDEVTHDFSGGKGRVVGLRVLKPYTVMVQWGTFFKAKKDWYDPKVLRRYAPTGNELEERVSEITAIEDNQDRHNAIIRLVEEIKKEAYDEGYNNCQETYGDGPSN